MYMNVRDTKLYITCTYNSVYESVEFLFSRKMVTQTYKKA